jgi:hypothetical protein
MEVDVMRLTTYFIIMFSIELMLYFMGYPTFMNGLWAIFQGQIDPATIFSSLVQAVATTNPLTLLLGGAIVGVAVLAGFSAMFIIPMMILLSLLNYVVIPTSFFLPAGCSSPASAALLGAVCQPDSLGLVVIIFLNICTLLTYVEFVRGSA